MIGPWRSFPRRKPALAVLAVMVGLGAWSIWEARARRGWIVLANAGPAPLMAQVLPESGDEPLGPPFDLVKRYVLELPDGDYRLRVNGVGRLGRTFRFAVNRGETLKHEVALEEGRLLVPHALFSPALDPFPPERPMPFAPETRAIELTPGKKDLLERTENGLVRRDGLTGNVVWDTARARVVPRKIDRAARAVRKRMLANWSYLIDVKADLDGDGARDFVLAVDGPPEFLAVSGRDGSTLWSHAIATDGRDLPPADDPGLPGPVRPSRRSATLYEQGAVADLDGDGVPDLIANLWFSELPEESARRDPKGTNSVPFYRRMIEAVSGRTGRKLWHHWLDAKFANGRRLGQSRIDVARGRDRSIVGHLEGAVWSRFDAATGEPAGSIDLGFEPARPVQLADVDGDGAPELLALGADLVGAAPQALTAFAIDTGKALWTAPISVRFREVIDNQRPLWPWLVRLDGGGRADIVVPDAGTLTATARFRGARLIDGRSGKTRWARPLHVEGRMPDGLLDAIDGPDLDRDGVCDLVLASYDFGRSYPPLYLYQSRLFEPIRMFVDAVSGRDGRPLWEWHKDVPIHHDLPLQRPAWWGRGPDGWPLLAIAVGPLRYGGGHRDPAVVHVLEASTGREVSTAVGLKRARVDDLDGDGLDDLWGEADGQLRAFRGAPPELWAALGRYRHAEAERNHDAGDRAAIDLNGDGTADLLNFGFGAPATSIHSDGNDERGMASVLTPGFTGPAPVVRPPGTHFAVARSGRDGRVLWKARVGPACSWIEPGHGEGYRSSCQSPPVGDLDGDGTPDVLVWHGPLTFEVLHVRHAATLPLEALSGRDGRRLWSAGPLPLGAAAFGFSDIRWAGARVIGPGRSPDVVVRHANSFTTPVSAPPAGGRPVFSHLARVSGRDGSILWDVPLNEHVNGGWAIDPPPPEFGDIDGDGSLDAVLIARRADGGQEIQAFALRDGRKLWASPLEIEGQFLGGPKVAVADLDGDRRPEIIEGGAFEVSGRRSFALRALDGRNGAVRWSWIAPETPPDVGAWCEGCFVLLDFENTGRLVIALDLWWHNARARKTQTYLVDDTGETISRRERPMDRFAPYFPPDGIYVPPRAADVNGDKSDELLVYYEHRLHAWDGALREIWASPRKYRVYDPRNTMRRPGGAGTVLVPPPPTSADGPTGRRRWEDHGPHHWRAGDSQAWLFDPIGPARVPMFLPENFGMTVCRSALPTDEHGAYLPARGTPARPDAKRLHDDPRWKRPLPWMPFVAREDVRAGAALALMLAALNLVPPLTFLRLVKGRKRWTVRTLMMVPVAAAMPLFAYRAVVSRVPVQPTWPNLSTGALYALGTIVGAPALVLAVWTIGALARGRFKQMAWLAVLTFALSFIVAAVWIGIDRRSMAPIEHYDVSGWPWAVLLGAYATGVVLLIAWAVRGAVRLVRPR